MEISTNFPPARSDSSVPAHRLTLTTLQKVAIPVGAIWFYILFWEERPALNVLLYTLFVLAGYRLGEDWERVTEAVGLYSKAVAVFAVLAVLAFLTLRLTRPGPGKRRA